MSGDTGPEIDQSDIVPPPVEHATAPDRKEGGSQYTLRPLFDKEMMWKDPSGATLLLESHFSDLSNHLSAYLKQLGLLQTDGGSLNQVFAATQDRVRSQIANDKKYGHQINPEFSQEQLDLAEAEYAEAVEKSKSEIPRSIARGDVGKVRLISSVFDDYVFAEYARAKIAQLPFVGNRANLAVEEFGIPEVPFHNGVPIHDLMTATMHRDDKPLY